MACLNPDGTLTSSAQALLKLASEPVSPEEISAELGTPLYKVRASLREMLISGLMLEKEGGYQSTEEGLERVGAINRGIPGGDASPERPAGDDTRQALEC